MAEKSMFWSTGATGDGLSAYTQAELFSFFSRATLASPFYQGILVKPSGTGNNNLAIVNWYAGAVPTASPFNLEPGSAYVNGIPYISDANTSIVVTTPVAGTTGCLVILRADYTAQTVRLVVKRSADGVATIPSVTQTIGTTWEIGLYSLTITTGGAIASVTDVRQLIVPLGMRDYTLSSYYSGSASGVFPRPVMDRESQIMGKVSALATATTTVTFPFTFLSAPLVLISPVSAGAINNPPRIYLTGIGTSSFTILNGESVAVNVQYMAIGPVNS